MNLKLSVTKGPSSGSHFQFSPQVKVNVGRLVRGNKVSIKDAGISSKHLLIQFDIESGNWTVTDLNSSNGTLLNSNSLTPNTNYDLQDDDLIKFGEETAIRVTIEGKGGEVGCGENVGKGFRGTRRGAGFRCGKLGVIEEGADLGLGFGEENVDRPKRVTRRRAGLKGEELGVIVEDGGLRFGNENVKVEENVAKPKRGRRLRSGLNGGGLGVIVEDGGLGLGFDKENEERISRSIVKKDVNDVIGKEGEILEDLGENGEKDVGVVPTGLRRATRGSRRKGNDGGKDGELGLRFDEELGANEQKMGRGRVQKSENSEIGKEGRRLEDLRDNEGKDAGLVSTGLRRVTRGLRRKGNDGAKNDEEMGASGTGRVTRGGRVTRSLRIKEMSEIKLDDDARGKEREKGPAKSRKRTRSTSIEICGLRESGIGGGLVKNSEVVEITEKKGCGDRLASAEMKLSGGFNNGQIRQEEIAEKSTLREEGDCNEMEKNGEGDRGESSQEKVCGEGLPSSSETNLSVLGRLEKMTLGQWLDYIEEYLPKQIVAETEEMIMEMKQKAERFHEFMLEQNASKGGGDI